MAKVVPNPEAAAAITECILDHPFNGEQQSPTRSCFYSQQLSNIIVQHIGGTQTLTHIYWGTLQILLQSQFSTYLLKLALNEMKMTRQRQTEER